MARIKRSLSDRIIAKENQRLLKNIKRRITRLKAKYGTTRAIQKFEEKKIPLTTRGLTSQQLVEQKRNLMYINSLKTSRVKGQENYIKHYAKVESLFEFDKKLKDRFFSIYDKITEENLWLENFKYEIFEMVEEYMTEGMSDEDIRNRIMEFAESKEEENAIELTDSTTLYGTKYHKHRQHRSNKNRK